MTLKILPVPWLSAEEGSVCSQKACSEFPVFYGLENALCLLAVLMHGKSEGQRGEINSDP